MRDAIDLQSEAPPALPPFAPPASCTRLSTRLASAPEGLDPADTTFRYKGDEHGALMLPPGAPVRLGQTLDFVPSHCDPTVNLYPRYHLMRGGEWTGHWPILGRTGAA